MKIIHNTISKALALIMATALTAEADSRVWTSKKGTTIEAEFVSYENGRVNLTTKDAKAISMNAMDLSLADRQYLVENAKADKAELFKGKITVPEKKFRKPRKFLKKLEAQLTLGGSECVFDLYETEHYLFACSEGVSPKGIAETAEACWYGMAFQHNEFRENWGDTKFLYVLPKNIEIYKEVGEFVVKELTDKGKGEYAQRVQATWDRTGANYVEVPAEAMKKFNLKPAGRVFRTKDPKKYRKPFDPFQTHNITKRLFVEQAGQPGFYALSTGHSYYKEILLTRRTETHQLSNDYDEGIGSKSGFKDGTSWAKTLKKMVKKGEIKLDLTGTLGIKNANDLDPAKLVTMYALSYYLQSTQKRMAAYAELVREINSSRAIPAPAAIAKIYGFDSVEAFQKDWVEFVTSRDFK